MMNESILITLSNPSSYVTESYKLLRTNLNYINVQNKYQVIFFTSGVKKEGKTTTICNLAITLAQSGKSVLLIDADLRMPRVGNIFDISEDKPGLSNMLVDGLILDSVVNKVDKIEKFDILTAGNRQVSPTELLNSDAFEKMIIACRKEYDMILIDTPPVLNFADASIVSKVTDGAILVVAANETKKAMIVEAKNNIDKVGGVLLGVVLTKVKYKKSSHYYGYEEDKIRLKKEKKVKNEKKIKRK